MRNWTPPSIQPRSPRQQHQPLALQMNTASTHWMGVALIYWMDAVSTHWLKLLPTFQPMMRRFTPQPHNALIVKPSTTLLLLESVAAYTVHGKYNL